MSEIKVGDFVQINAVGRAAGIKIKSKLCVRRIEAHLGGLARYTREKGTASRGSSRPEIDRLPLIPLRYLEPFVKKPEARSLAWARLILEFLWRRETSFLTLNAASAISHPVIGKKIQAGWRACLNQKWIESPHRLLRNDPTFGDASLTEEGRAEAISHQKETRPFQQEMY